MEEKEKAQKIARILLATIHRLTANDDGTNSFPSSRSFQPTSNRPSPLPRNGPKVQVDQLGQDNFALGEKKLVNVARILSRRAPDTSISRRSFAPCLILFRLWEQKGEEGIADRANLEKERVRNWRIWPTSRTNGPRAGLCPEIYRLARGRQWPFLKRRV